jgi:ABC-type lipoprotein export system ATPase subunit
MIQPSEASLVRSTPAAPDRPLIELRSVVKKFKTSAGEFTALKGIDLEFSQGEFTSIMGKSGSGKSTLINMITGIDHPTSGMVRVGDTELLRLSEGKLAVWRGRAMGIVFQFFQLLPTLTVLENTLLPMDYCNRYPLAEREPRARELLKLLDLSDLADKLPAALSGGQQQIAAIARALANDPPIVVADEPTGNLDSATEQLILAIFEDLARRGKTILIVTHDPALARRSTRRVLISDGELVNEVVAQALPSLPHNQLLLIGKIAAHRTYEPGATIARQGALDEGLYIVTKGAIQVFSEQRLRAPRLVSQIQPGQYFSEMELLETEACNLIFRAAPERPVEALCVSLEKFNQLVEDPATERALRHAAIERSALFCPRPAPRRFLWWRL